MARKSDKEVVGQIIQGPEELERIEAELLALPMRDAIVRTLTLFDITIELWLHAEWKNTPADFEALCMGDKPLSTSSAKIHIARCLGIITETHSKVLQIIKKVRNDCSHRYYIDFSTSKYEDLTRQLLKLKGQMVLEMQDPSIEELKSNYEHAVLTGDVKQQNFMTTAITEAMVIRKVIERELASLYTVKYEPELLRAECVKLMASIYVFIYLQFEERFGQRTMLSFGDSYKQANEEYARLYGSRPQ